MAECGSESDAVREMRSHASQSETHRRLGRWENSCTHANEHIRLSRELGDKREECKGLHSLGAVLHTRGKRESALCKGVDPGCYPPAVTGPLTESLSPYEGALFLSRGLGDRGTEGRVLGNLGSVCYLLGRFPDAVLYHGGRLEVAVGEGDTGGQKRAHSNLGNAYVYMGDINRAIGHYKQGLLVARGRGDLSSEGQLCYSIGNSYTLLREYGTATEYQQRHLEIATRLRNKAGSMRAYWALSNSCSCLRRHREALRYSRLHLSVATELGDSAAVETARHNVSALERHTGRRKDSGQDPETEEMLPLEGCTGPVTADLPNGDHSDIQEVLVEQQGDELTPEGAQQDRLDLFLLERLCSSQGNRLEDQRCAFAPLSPPLPPRAKVMSHSRSVDTMLSLIGDTQEHRIEEQRAPLRDDKEADSLVGERRKLATFIDRCQIHSLEEQRSTATFQPLGTRHFIEYEQTEDFFNLILQAQSHRIDDQRTTAAVPLL